MGGFGFEVLWEGSGWDVMEIELVRMFGFEERVNGMEIVGVLFLVLSVEGEFLE